MTFFLVWVALSLVLLPLVGRWLRRRSEAYPVATPPVRVGQAGRRAGSYGPQLDALFEPEVDPDDPLTTPTGAPNVGHGTRCACSDCFTIRWHLRDQ